ncbi:MAG: hypothetical protein JXB49_26395, partial [Bacteroidales bacterium]|nr:hypothetical protein [Bacteroidales bacterium]
TPDGKKRKIHYLSGGDGLSAIYVEEDGNSHFYYAYTDYLGSLTALTDADGNVEERQAFDPWGNRREPYDWTSLITTPVSNITGRGYTMHEHLDGFALINMNGRVYDPQIARFLSPDPQLQAPGYWLNYNRYGYCWNNPLMYTDPSGEIVWMPIIIGAIVGAYIGGSTANGTYDPTMWDYNSGKTWGYMLGGAVVGGVSGGLAYGVATSGIPFANTAAIMTGSFTNSVGMNIVTGGQTPVSISFGVASYNFTSGDWGYLGKKGNSALENIGYGLGALANVADILAGFKPGSVELRTENDPNYSKPEGVYDENGRLIGTRDVPRKDLIGHSQLNRNGKPVVDWGPTEGVSGFGDWVPGTNSYEGGVPIATAKMKWSPLTIDGVNVNRISSWNPSGKYNLAFNSCVSQTSRALNASGVFNVGIHPYLLHAQIYLRSIGFRPSLFSSYMYQY